MSARRIDVDLDRLCGFVNERARTRETTSRASLSVIWPNTMTLRPLNRRDSSSLTSPSAGFLSPLSGASGFSGVSSGSPRMDGWWRNLASFSGSTIDWVTPMILAHNTRRSLPPPPPSLDIEAG